MKTIKYFSLGDVIPEEARFITSITESGPNGGYTHLLLYEVPVTPHNVRFTVEPDILVAADKLAELLSILDETPVAGWSFAVAAVTTYEKLRGRTFRRRKP